MLQDQALRRDRVVIRARPVAGRRVTARVGGVGGTPAVRFPGIATPLAKEQLVKK